MCFLHDDVDILMSMQVQHCQNTLQMVEQITNARKIGEAFYLSAPEELY